MWEEIIYLAGQETKIEEKLNEIVTKWKGLSFPLSKYKDTPILGDITELEIELEDDILNIQTLSSSRFVKYFREKVAEWDKNLNMVADCVKVWSQMLVNCFERWSCEVWLLTQQKWMYLEGIFIGSEDIRMQLKDAATEFDRWRLISLIIGVFVMNFRNNFGQRRNKKCMKKWALSECIFNKTWTNIVYFTVA